eukprot:scaffold4025_cov106-Cylindrotheca_fusiformis.AAC.6
MNKLKKRKGILSFLLSSLTGVVLLVSFDQVSAFSFDIASLSLHDQQRLLRTNPTVKNNGLFPTRRARCKRASCSRPPRTTTTTRLNEQEQENTVLMISEVDVQHDFKNPLHYDPVQDRFVVSKQEERNNNRKKGAAASILRPMLSSAFIPEGVNDSYFQYMRWRFLQRFVNANLHVIGTQSLLLGLGIKSNKLGVSAALNWVLKDALGKIGRMVWASRMGRRFDSDAKRWRFRASLLFAFGNYLEIVTYMMPQLFLLWATLANCFKQIAMLTSSSTRTSLYNSFRDGTRENIGDITAKGEAQIAIVDLLGIGSGVLLSKFVVGTAVQSVLATFAALQALEIFCMYHEIRSVQFRVLNFERLTQVIRNFVQAQSKLPTTVVNGGATTTTTQQPQLAATVIPTPEEMSRNESIFLPPEHLSRRALAFGSLGRAKLSEQELVRLLDIFEKERFLLVVGPNVKKNRWFNAKPSIQEHCHIVLHEDASNADIVKSTLALIILREKLIHMEHHTKDDLSNNNWEELRSSHCWDILEETSTECDRLFPKFLRELSSRKWAPPSRFMFGRVHMRARWPLKPRKTPPTNSAAPQHIDNANGKAKT